MFFGGPRFRELIPQFLSFQTLYSEDRRTTPSNLRILERYIGALKLPEISPQAIEKVMAARLAEGIGRSTINRQLATLSRFFTWAIAQKHFAGPNPVRQIRKFKESAGRTRFLTSEEASKLLLASPPHLKRVVTAALHTGGRLGELLALRWKDIDLDHGVILFRRETTKSKRERIIPMSPAVAEMLRTMRRGPAEEPVFGWRGEGLKSVRTAFENAREKAGLPDLHFHDLRHTFASWYV